jgi:uncharacterized damage-inducible protein DinB
MYTSEVLLDILARAHESLRRLIGFLARLSEEELQRELPGFGIPTIIRQLRHTISAEQYWQTVIIRGYTEEAEPPTAFSLAELEQYRQETFATTKAYLESANAEELNGRREMFVDPGITDVLRPADIIVRLATHIFNHQGQVLAMCRTLGKPNAEIVDLDYPLTEDMAEPKYV